MLTATSLEELHTALGSGPRTLVPTMGYLHEGHMSLVQRARGHPGSVVLSIFVNPLQFGAGEGLDEYPRDLDADLTLAESRGVDLVFMPPVETLYPGGTPTVTVDPGAMADRLCGAYRPGHFRGVLTVVAKLFNLVRPDVSIFGRKDFQQTVLVRRMITDLNMDVGLDVAPIIREPDGLALSSRNIFLDLDARQQALGLSRALARVAREFDLGERNTTSLLGHVDQVMSSHPGLRPQYAEIVSSADLEPVARAAEGDVVALAGFCGEVRLIDNVTLGERAQ